MNHLTIEDLKNDPMWIIETEDHQLLEKYLDTDPTTSLNVYTRQIKAVGVAVDEVFYECIIPAIPGFICKLSQKDMEGSPANILHRKVLEFVKQKSWGDNAVFLISNRQFATEENSDLVVDYDLGVNLDIIVHYAHGDYVTMYEAIEMIAEGYGHGDNTSWSYSYDGFRAHFIGYDHCLNPDPVLQQGIVLYQKTAVEKYIAELIKLYTTFMEPNEYEEVGPFDLNKGITNEADRISKKKVEDIIDQIYDIEEDGTGLAIPVRYVNLKGETLELCDEPIIEINEATVEDGGIMLTLDFRHGAYPWKIQSMYRRGEASMTLAYNTSHRGLRSELTLVVMLDEEKLQSMADF